MGKVLKNTIVENHHGNFVSATDNDGCPINKTEAYNSWLFGDVTAFNHYDEKGNPQGWTINTEDSHCDLSTIHGRFIHVDFGIKTIISTIEMAMPVDCTDVLVTIFDFPETK